MKKEAAADKPPVDKSQILIEYKPSNLTQIEVSHDKKAKAE